MPFKLNSGKWNLGHFRPSRVKSLDRPIKGRVTTWLLQHSESSDFPKVMSKHGRLWILEITHHPTEVACPKGCLFRKLRGSILSDFTVSYNGKNSKKLSTCYSILYQGDVGKMCCVWDSKTSHAVSVTPFLWKNQGHLTLIQAHYLTRGL